MVLISFCHTVTKLSSHIVLVVYLQVEVGLAFGVLAISIEHFCTSCMFLPFAVRELREVKNYTYDKSDLEEMETVHPQIR